MSTRCPWVGELPIYIDYHDKEWGKPQFDSQKLFAALKEIKNNNAQGEYYLTDVPEILRLQGERVGVFSKEIGREIIGVNTVEQLTEVEEIIKEREK